LLHLVGSSVLLYLIDDARSNKNQIEADVKEGEWEGVDWDNVTRGRRK